LERSFVIINVNILLGLVLVGESGVKRGKDIVRLPVQLLDFLPPFQGNLTLIHNHGDNQDLECFNKSDKNGDKIDRVKEKQKTADYLKKKIGMRTGEGNSTRNLDLNVNN